MSYRPFNHDPVTYSDALELLGNRLDGKQQRIA